MRPLASARTSHSDHKQDMQSSDHDRLFEVMMIIIVSLPVEKRRQKIRYERTLLIIVIF